MNEKKKRWAGLGVVNLAFLRLNSEPVPPVFRSGTDLQEPCVTACWIYENVKSALKKTVAGKDWRLQIVGFSGWQLFVYVCVCVCVQVYLNT